MGIHVEGSGTEGKSAARSDNGSRGIVVIIIGTCVCGGIIVIICVITGIGVIVVGFSGGDVIITSGVSFVEVLAEFAYFVGIINICFLGIYVIVVICTCCRYSSGIIRIIIRVD